VVAKIFAQDDAEVFFCRAVGWTIVVSQVEMGDTPVKGAAENGPSGLENIGAAKVLPEAQRNRLASAAE
jgi:hypothetical protein